MERQDRIRARRRGAVLCLGLAFVVFLVNSELGRAKYDDWLRYALYAVSLLLVPAAAALWWRAAVLDRAPATTLRSGD